MYKHSYSIEHPLDYCNCFFFQGQHVVAFRIGKSNMSETGVYLLQVYLERERNDTRDAVITADGE